MPARLCECVSACGARATRVRENACVRACDGCVRVYFSLSRSSSPPSLHLCTYSSPYVSLPHLFPFLYIPPSLPPSNTEYHPPVSPVPLRLSVRLVPLASYAAPQSPRQSHQESEAPCSSCYFCCVVSMFYDHHSSCASYADCSSVLLGSSK